MTICNNDMFSCVGMDEGIDWDQGLPLDMLAMVAGGAEAMKAMRGVSKTWQRGFSVTKLTIRKPGPIPRSMGRLAERFPGLTSLDLGESLMDPSCLARLANLKNLVSLSFAGGHPVEYGWIGPELDQLSYKLTSLKPLRGIPLQSLSLYGCGHLVGDALGPLQGMPLTSLNLCHCCKLSSASWGKPSSCCRVGASKHLLDMPEIWIRGKRQHFGCLNRTIWLRLWSLFPCFVVMGFAAKSL